MTARSKQQQMAAAAALSAKKGEKKVFELRGASKQMHESMNTQQLREIAQTKRKNLPKKKAAKG